LALITHLVFLGGWGLLLFHFGHWVQFWGMRPDFFLWIALFLLRRSQYPHLILLVVATGLVSDLYEGHPWGSDALFFCLMHIAMDRLGGCSSLKRFHFFFLWGIWWCGLHYLWLLHVNDSLSWRQFSPFLLSNLVAIVPVYFFFQTIGLGWGTRLSSSDAPILNA